MRTGAHSFQSNTVEVRANSRGFYAGRRATMRGATSWSGRRPLFEKQPRWFRCNGGRVRNGGRDASMRRPSTGTLPDAVTLAISFQTSCRALGDVVAVATPIESVTYAELGHRAERFAAALVARGLEAGDRVAVWL